MAEPPICPRCGSELPARAPRSLCPRCLLRAGLDGESLSLSHPGEVGATIDLSGPESVLEALAATVGPLPRVLLRDEDPGSEAPVNRPVSPEMPATADRATRLRLLGEIARGGMGAVLKGRDEDLGRDLAVKVLLEKHCDDPDLIRRFIEEAQIGGQLQHPGVVPIYELGAFADRRPYFAMKLVKGQTLAALLAGRKDPVGGRPRLLGVFEQVCQTVAYAHARGVIHRDLKPSNVMVGSFGEVQVMDWGLAKVLPRGGAVEDRSAGKPPDDGTVIARARSGADSDFSRAGSVMGTPAYMAPEQARGEIHVVDERADAFALGSILCEILTGAPAFVGRSSAEIQRKAARGEVADAFARLDACGADAELAALARDCLVAEPADRLRDAGAVSGRMTAYLSGVQERLRAAELDRARAEAMAAEERRRRRLQLGLAASVLALVALGGSAATYEWRRRQAREVQGALALSEAATLRDQARGSPDDPARWRAADEALKRASLALSGPGSPTARNLLEALRAEVDAGLAAAERDVALLRELVDIRSVSVDDPDGTATDEAYARAFAAAGIDPIRGDPTEAGARVARRPRTVAAAMLAALDDWAGARLKRDTKGVGWRRVLDAACAADPDRGAMLAARVVGDKADRLARLRPLAVQAEAGSWAPASMLRLGQSLAGAGDLEAGLAVLRRASWAHPEDADVHRALGRLLREARPPRREEAIRALSAAWALRPELAGHELAHSLERMGRGDEAQAVWRDLIGRRPDNLNHLTCYGKHLKSQGRAAEAAPILARAIAAYREAVRLRPDEPKAYSNLGDALVASGDLPGAIAACREAIRLKPDFAEAHLNLGYALGVSGDPRGAISPLREAIRLQPDNTAAHFYLGVSLQTTDDLPGAIAAYREVIALWPEHFMAYSNLGVSLQTTDDLPGAIAAYREAIRLRPDEPKAYSNLGDALVASGDLPGAIAACREAIRLQPDYPMAHCNLSSALRRDGRYAEALAEIRRGHELGSKLADWRYPSAQWVAEAERLAALAERLPAVLGGTDKPADHAERLALAQTAYDTRRYAGAARLWSEALEAVPSLADDRRAQHRYNAACAAALAAAGKGEDDPKPDDAARGKLRGQALAWLKAELATWSDLLGTDDPKLRASVGATLRHWQQDPDLAGVRDADALAALPESDQANWRALWAEVDAALKRARPD